MQTVRLGYCRILAASCYYVLELAGAEVFLFEDAVFYKTELFRVIPECDGFSILAVFVAAAAAMPVWRHAPQRRVALRTALMVLAALVALNWVRLWVLAALALFRPALYEAIHLYLMQGTLILFTVVAVEVWMQRAMKPPSAAARAD